MLKRNWASAYKARIEKRSFENAQVRMRESRSFRAWWETVCFLGKQMHFQSIELWKRRNGDYVNTYVWNAPEGNITTDKTVEFSFPLYGNGTAEREIRVRTSVNGYLELNGRQAMLLARLMDGFPPPDKEQESEELNLFNQHDTRSTIKEKA